MSHRHRRGRGLFYYRGHMYRRGDWLLPHYTYTTPVETKITVIQPQAEVPGIGIIIGVGGLLVAVASFLYFGFKK